MQRVTVVARIKAKRKYIDRVKQELAELIAPTRREPGCLTYDLYQNVDNRSLFLFHEIWESQALLEEHSKSERLKAYRQATEEMIEEREISVLANIEES
ncbi:MAG TPA: putative quinol monooxygenase [Thermodesulfobacteriota bacterium]|nr:putative quinol monooxygenase [Thermodesulfobacteriota bacterium]